jgi:hypothetical protein
MLSGRPKPGGKEETLEGGRGPPRAVAPLERVCIMLLSIKIQINTYWVIRNLQF